MTLPILLSLPHAGLRVPAELEGMHRLTPEQIAADGDEGAAEVYDFADEVVARVTTDIARAFVDMNRAPDDIRKDGVVKSHTCWDVEIWNERPTPAQFAEVIDRYHRPYHDRLRARFEGAIVGVDGHTMAAFGPPVGPDTGRPRPMACIGIADGTCPRPWAERLAEHLSRHLGHPVRINDPFQGGYIIREHRSERPWLMLELSRSPALSPTQKRDAVLGALTDWCHDPRGPKRG